MSNVFPATSLIIQRFEDETKDPKLNTDDIAYAWFKMLTDPAQTQQRIERGYPPTRFSEREAFKHMLMLVYINGAE